MRWVAYTSVHYMGPPKLRRVKTLIGSTRFVPRSVAGERSRRRASGAKTRRSPRARGRESSCNVKGVGVGALKPRSPHDLRTEWRSRSVSQRKKTPFDSSSSCVAGHPLREYSRRSTRAWSVSRTAGNRPASFGREVTNMTVGQAAAPCVRTA